ncbi:MAG TPA: M81 family metallopeptidase [Acidimicrobiales bacterium]|nr:M81 family metallopeptidase [Acidimicrobiales bacterium]
MTSPAPSFRLGIGGLVHETNTYATATFGETDRQAFRVLEGERILATQRGVRSCLGGMLAGADEVGAEVVPLWWASAEPSGTIAAAAYETMRGELLAAIERALPLDALALDLHGAGVVEGTADLEADLGRAVRELVGDIPVVVTLDLHGNVSDDMARLFDVMLGYHLYPHTDMWERGHEAVLLLPRLLDGSLRPAAHVEHLPVLLPTSTTDRGFPAFDMNELCARLEEIDGVVDCTVFHGFPFTDVPQVGVHVAVTTDGDPDLARRVGGEVGRWIWQHRERFRTESPTPDQAVRLALAAWDAQLADRPDGEQRPVVVNETSDNPGGGTPGDGTHLLRAMIEGGATASAFGTMFDPEVVAAAHTAGVGQTIEVSLGGKHDSLHGEPLRAAAYVKSLTDGRFVLTALAVGARVGLGRTARLQVGGIDVIVAERRTQTFDPEVFLLHGIDVRRCRVVGVKSSNHFRAGFAPLAAEIITADAPGLTTNRVEVFSHARATRPLWPTDPAATYEPGATLT